MTIPATSRTILALLAAGALAAPVAAQDLVSFRTPSDNIHCLASAGPPAFVDCEIRETSAAPLLPRPASCDLDWGRRFVVEETGGAYMACAGDTVVSPGSAVLDYGHSATFGGVMCLSSEAGLTCGNAQGHGFMLARAGQQLR